MGGGTGLSSEPPAQKYLHAFFQVPVTLSEVASRWDRKSTLTVSNKAQAVHETSSFQKGDAYFLLIPLFVPHATSFNAASTNTYWGVLH